MGERFAIARYEYRPACPTAEEVRRVFASHFPSLTPHEAWETARVVIVDSVESDATGERPCASVVYIKTTGWLSIEMTLPAPSARGGSSSGLLATPAGVVVARIQGISGRVKQMRGGAPGKRRRMTVHCSADEQVAIRDTVEA